MSKINQIQTDFTTGEISRKCIGRVDIQRYAHALEECRNMCISPQGGTYRRPGTFFVYPTPNNQYTRIIDFRFSTLNAAIIEFSGGLIRFYQNQGIVLSGGTPYSVVSPYAAADLPLLKFTQSASILYVFHQKYAPAALSQLGSTNWTLSNLTLQDGPYLPSNYTDGITYLPASTLACGGIAAGSTGTVTASTSGFFQSTDVGRHIRLYNGSATSATQLGWGIITAYTDSQHVTVTAQVVIPAGTESYWFMGAFGGRCGYPALGTFFQQRLTMANTPVQPSAFYMSQSGNFYNFGPSLFDTTVTDSCGIAYSIASSQINSILWMSASQVLMLGTDGAEWQVSSNSYNSSPVTPTNIYVALQTSNGALQTARALRVGWETIFLARTGRNLLKLVYTFQINGFVSNDLSVLAEHILREGNELLDMAYQEFPHSILWFPRQLDGKLAALTYINEQQITGWHLHTIAGPGAFVTSVACIPTPDGTKDQLWMVVQRTVNGQLVQSVEYMNIPFESNDVPENQMCFLDGAVSWTNSTPSTALQLPNSFVQGQYAWDVSSMAAFVDGSYVPITNGVLSKAGLQVTLGYPYPSQMKILRLEGGGSSGTAQGKFKRVGKLTLRLYETMGFEWSINGDDPNAMWNTVDFRTSDNAMGAPVPLYTGDYRISLDMPSEFEGQFWIRQDQPYPLTVVALMPETMVNQ